jgi:hypothetical protein
MGWTYEKRQGVLLFLAASYAMAIGLKRSMHEAHHSSSSNAEIKNRHIYVLVLHLSLYAVVLNYVWKCQRHLPFIQRKNREGKIQLRRLSMD